MEGLLARSAVARWAVALPFGMLGLVCLAAAPATGLLSLPFGMLFTATTVWLLKGAEDPPTRGIRWAMTISGGLTALMIFAGIAAAIIHNWS